MPRRAVDRKSAIKRICEVEQHFAAQVAAKAHIAQQRDDQGDHGPSHCAAGLRHADHGWRSSFS